VAEDHITSSGRIDSFKKEGPCSLWRETIPDVNTSIPWLRKVRNGYGCKEWRLYEQALLLPGERRDMRMACTACGRAEIGRVTDHGVFNVGLLCQ
jgi:hypothetical protein